NATVEGQLARLTTRAGDQVRPLNLLGIQSHRVLEQLSEESFAASTDLSINRSHASGRFVSRIEQRRIEAKPRVERIALIQRSELVQRESGFAPLAKLRPIVFANSQR